MNKWISVNDRLPDNSNVVLAYNLKNSRGIYIHKIYFAFYYEYRWTQSNDAAWKMDVTHWMPLPNPPEEESEPIGNSEQLPVAWFYEDDMFKFVSTHKDALPREAIPLYTHPMRDDEEDDIFRKEQVKKFYAETRPLSEKYKLRELTDDEIIDAWKMFPNWGHEQHILMFGRELLKKAGEK